MFKKCSSRREEPLRKIYRQKKQKTKLNRKRTNNKIGVSERVR